MTVAVYPGTFNPPTVGHLAIVTAAFTQHSLTELHLVVSQDPLGKAKPTSPTLIERIAVIEASVAHLAGASVHVTEHRLIADIAVGYDLVIMGADKWHQLHDVSFYESAEHRDTALASLPRVTVAPRTGHDVPDEHRLLLPDHVGEISSSAVRRGRGDWMTPAAQAAGHWG